MLTFKEAIALMAADRPLPQDDLPAISEEVCGAVQSGTIALLGSLLDTMRKDGDPEAVIPSGVKRLVDTHGWWPACGVSAIELGSQYGLDTVDHLPASVSNATRTLLKAFAVGAEHADVEGVWRLPLAMLASLGEENAPAFIECALCCAGFDALRRAGLR